MADEPTSTAGEGGQPQPTPTPAPTAEPAAPKAGDPPKEEPKLPEGGKSSVLSEEPPKEGEKKEPPKEEPKPFDVATIKLPEGVEADEETMNKFGEIATKRGIDSETAQELIDLQAGLMKKAGDSAYKAWEDTQETWVKEVKADPEIGGSKLQEVRATIAKGIDQAAKDPNEARAFRQALDYTGAGNNPAVIRLLLRMSQSLVEGGHVGGNPPGQAKQTGAAALYPHLAEKQGTT